MAGHKKDEPKQIYSYRAKPSVIKKAKMKVKRDKITFSEKIEELLCDYAGLTQPQVLETEMNY